VRAGRVLHQAGGRPDRGRPGLHPLQGLIKITIITINYCNYQQKA
jgi:hypothetical protein